MGGGSRQSKIAINPANPFGRQPLTTTSETFDDHFPNSVNLSISRFSMDIDDIFPGQSPDGGGPTMYNPTVITEVPSLLPSFNESQRPSIMSDKWALPLAQVLTSGTNSPLDYSPNPEAVSPRYVEDVPDLVDFAATSKIVKRKPIGPRPSKVVSDLAAASKRLLGTFDTSNESLKLVGRSSLDMDNTARDHLYHNVTPQADGLYHCPWEKDPNFLCQHKPEKLKCNYEYETYVLFS